VGARGAVGRPGVRPGGPAPPRGGGRGHPNGRGVHPGELRADESEAGPPPGRRRRGRLRHDAMCGVGCPDGGPEVPCGVSGARRGRISRVGPMGRSAAAHSRRVVPRPAGSDGLLPVVEARSRVRSARGSRWCGARARPGAGRGRTRPANVATYGTGLGRDRTCGRDRPAGGPRQTGRLHRRGPSVAPGPSDLGHGRGLGQVDRTGRTVRRNHADGQERAANDRQHPRCGPRRGL
jgi:hypothetical protein